ncbi:2Fe-2S iron-sulfur cluster-binding protein [Roseibium salinum]|nr:2Fe-2S iron-sulfur cluster-binding protein [Roseibium salinum]
MTKLIIDGKEVDVPADYTLLQACEEAGAEVPRFCYHERLSIAGNCRMCLVEVKGGPPKPTASCAMGVKDLRPGPNGEPPVVETRSEMVKKAREGGDGVPAHQPPAGLPDLRPGRRVRPAGSGHGLRGRRVALCRKTSVRSKTRKSVRSSKPS